MVQEVQTGVWITNETTLETIQAIGTSSFKIVEWRQTKGGHYVSWCTATMIVRRHGSADDRESPLVQWVQVSVDSQWGNAEYKVINNGIRVPVAWTYEISGNAKAGWSEYRGTTYLKLGACSGDETIYSLHGNSTKTENFTIRVNIGKFDVLTIRGDFYYNGSSSGTSLMGDISQMTITQL